jgi:hypothetical protein
MVRTPQETRRVKELLEFVDGQTTNPSLIAKNPHIKELVASGHRLYVSGLLNCDAVSVLEEKLAGVSDDDERSANGPRLRDTKSRQAAAMFEKLAQFASSMNRNHRFDDSQYRCIEIGSGGKSWQRHQRRTNPISEMDFRFELGDGNRGQSRIQCLS